MKVVVTLLGCINGLYMLVDGVFVLINGKYIGPENPGPWANLFHKLNMDVFKLGPMFILFGVAWLGWIIALWSGQSFAWLFGIIISILTLWYLPVGTLFSLIILVALMLMRNKGLL